MNKRSLRQELASLADLLVELHQDWAVDGSTPDDVIARYKGQNEAAQLERVVNDIDKLLDEGMTEEKLGDALIDLGCAYGPDLDGWKISDWLRSVQVKLRS